MAIRPDNLAIPPPQGCDVIATTHPAPSPLLSLDKWQRSDAIADKGAANAPFRLDCRSVGLRHDSRRFGPDTGCRSGGADLCGYRPGHLCRYADRRAGAAGGGECAFGRSVRRDAGRRPRCLACRPGALCADRDVPLWQPGGRRMGTPRELLAAGRGADRLWRSGLWRGHRRKPSRRAERDRRPGAAAGGGRCRCRCDHAGAAGQGAARAGRCRCQCRHRLSRDRVSVVGAGSERHRGRRGPAPVHRLWAGRWLHRRQLRPQGRLSDRPHRSAGGRSAADQRRLGPGAAMPVQPSPPTPQTPAQG